MAEDTVSFAANILKPKIKVFGVGGGGNSALMRMGQHKKLDIDLIAVNTDVMQLKAAREAGLETLQIGEGLTGGRGTGSNVEIGEQAAKEAQSKLEDAMNGADMIFLTAGMGGGTGTGAAPVLAKMAHDKGILTIGIVNMPFHHEGRRKRTIAEQGVAKMRAEMDALIAVQNDNLLKIPENRRLSVRQAFAYADKVLVQGINCVAELILTTGIINVDFADVTTILRQSPSSDALLGIGNSAHGAMDAVKQATSSPLVDKSIAGARGFILNLTGDSTLSIGEVNDAMEYIYTNTNPDVNIILGTVIDEDKKGEVQATIIATDFEGSEEAVGKKAESAENGSNPAAKPGFEVTPPAFMLANRKAEMPKTQPHPGAFAIPAFKLTPDK